MDRTHPASLTELQLDAITELVNLGVSNAASSLSQMVREEVSLSVPQVSVLTRHEAVAKLVERDARRLVAVRQDFAGDLAGRALLIFPETKSMELVKAVVGGDLSLEDIIELEHEALAETGNILLNSCLSTIANNLELSLKISLPELVRGDGTEFFELAHASDIGGSVLFIYINFSIRQRNIQGFIAMVMDIPSLETFQRFLIAFIERTTQ